MQKISFVILFIICFNLTGAQGADKPHRGLFVSLIQDPPVLSSPLEIKKLVEFSKNSDIKILFVQIYRANEAWFPSKMADDAPYRQCSSKYSKDAFAFLMDEAHRQGMEVHAWLNMLSLSKNKNAKILKKYGPEVLTRNLKTKETLEDYEIDNQYFLEPGDPRVRKELGAMIREILKAYPKLDGIQFDYMRYPDKNPFYGYTKTNMDRFKMAYPQEKISENNPNWKDWRRAQVTEFLKDMIKEARKISPRIQISSTGCMSYARAYHEAFQDWSLWVNRGWVDFVTLMSYTTDEAEFLQYIKEAKFKVINLKKVNLGIGAYEMEKSPDILKDQMRLCEDSKCGACVIFHYGSLSLHEKIPKT